MDTMNYISKKIFHLLKGLVDHYYYTCKKFNTRPLYVFRYQPSYKKAIDCTPLLDRKDASSPTCMFSPRLEINWEINFS